MTRHKHADLIHAWAEGAEIQVKTWQEEWKDDPLPDWITTAQYRIKPRIVKREGWGQITAQ